MNKLVLGNLKELLHTFNLPSCRVYREGMRLVPDTLYLKNDQYSLCKEDDSGKKTLIDVRHYTYGGRVINLTKNLKISTYDYDSYTHEYLGDYLRFHRDYKGINLMPLYNCCYGDKISGVETNIIINSNTSYSISDNDGFNYFSVPVKFFETYTIAIDAPVKYDLACIFYNNYYNKLSEDLVKISLKRINGSTFSNSYAFSTSFNGVTDAMIKLEPTLKLIIKVPKYITSSIVVLEGDYTMYKRVGNINQTTYRTYGNELGYKKLSLLYLNDRNQHYFSDILPDYLAGHAITKDDRIEENIERVQGKLHDYVGNAGIWDNRISKLLEENMYNIYGRNYIKIVQENGETTKEAKYRRYIDKYDDFLGFVDKNVEATLDEVNR